MRSPTLFALVAVSSLSFVACAETPPAATPPTATSDTSAAAVPASPASPTAASTDADPLVGKPAPDFTKTTFDGKEVHLAALKGKPVVVYFYPKDETPGCTKEACSFRDAWKDLSATGVTLIGVSTDDAESHKKFAEHWKLPFLLVSDPDGAIAKSFGVPVSEGYVARQTFVIDAAGNVKKVYRKVNVASHATEVMAGLTEVLCYGTAVVASPGRP